MKKQSEVKCGSLNLTKRVRALLMGAALVLCLTTANYAAAQAGPPTVFLGSAGTFAVLAAAGVTNTGPTVVTGDLGTYPTLSCTGLPTPCTGNGPGQVNGTIDSGDVIAQHAQASLLIAYNDAKGRTTNPIGVAGDLGGRTLTPGLYKSATTLAITGTLTLDGAGVYIFQVGTGLTVNTGAAVVLSGGATADNIFWQVGSAATLGTTADFKGTIMAGTAVTIATGARLNGRAMALTASVTMDSNNVTIPIGSQTVLVVLPPPPPPRRND
jgi:Ice-binding-like